MRFPQARLYASITTDAAALESEVKSALTSAGATLGGNLVDMELHSASDFSIAAILFTAGEAGAAALRPFADNLPVLFGPESISSELVLDSAADFLTPDALKQGIARINAGGTPLGASSGILWDGDFGFSAGEVVSAPSGSGVTTGATGLDVFLLQSARTTTNSAQSLLYDIPVPLPGTYSVRLYFAEFQECCTAAGSRVVDIFSEGQLISASFDIAAASGGSGQAQVVTFQMVALADTLSVALVPTVGNPIVSAIAVDIVSVLDVIIEDVGQGSTTTSSVQSTTTTTGTTTSTSTSTAMSTTPVPDVEVDDGVTGVDTNPASFVALGNFSDSTPKLSVKDLEDASVLLAPFLATELAGPAFLWASAATGDRPISKSGDVTESIDLTFPGQGAATKLRASLPNLPTSVLDFRTTRYSASYAQSRGVLVTVEVWEPTDSVQAVIQLRDDDGAVRSEGGIVELVLEPDNTLQAQAKVTLSAACEVPIDTVDGVCTATVTALPSAWFAVPEGVSLSPPPRLRARWRFLGDKNNKLQDLGSVTVQQRITVQSSAAMVTGTLPFAQQIRGTAVPLALDLKQGSQDHSYFLFTMTLSVGVVPQPLGDNDLTNGWSVTVAPLATPGQYAVAAKLIKPNQSLRGRNVQRMPTLELLLTAAAPSYDFVTVQAVVVAARLQSDNTLASIPTDGSEAFAFTSRTTTVVAEPVGTLFVLPNAIVGVLPYAAANEVVNTAVLSGQRTETELTVLGVAVDGSVSQTLVGIASCTSDTPSVLQVAEDCSSIFFDGSEFDGGEGVVSIDFGGLDPALIRLRVWFPALPVTASLLRSSGALKPVTGLLTADCKQAFESAQFAATTSFSAGDAETVPMAVSTFVRRQLQSSDPSVVRILDDGTVAGVAAGTANVFAEIGGFTVALLPVTVGGKATSIKTTGVAVANGVSFDFLDDVKPHKAWKFDVKTAQRFALPNDVSARAYAVATLSNNERMLLRPGVHDVGFQSLDKRTAEVTADGLVTVVGPGGGMLVSVRTGSCVLNNGDGGGLENSAQLGGVTLASGYIFSEVPAIESLTATITTKRISHHSSAAARLGIPVVATLTMALTRGPSTVDVTTSPDTVVDVSGAAGILGLVRTIDGGYRFHVSSPNVVGREASIVVSNGKLTTAVLVTVVGTDDKQAVEVRKVVNNKLQGGTFDKLNRYSAPVDEWQVGEVRFTVRLSDGSRLDVSKSALASITMTNDGGGVFAFNSNTRRVTVNPALATAALGSGNALPSAKFKASYNGGPSASVSLEIGEPTVDLKKVSQFTVPDVVTGTAGLPSGQFIRVVLEYNDGRTLTVYDGQGRNLHPGLLLAFSTNEERVLLNATTGELIPVSSTGVDETVAISVALASDLSTATVARTAVLLDSPVGQGDFGDQLELQFQTGKSAKLPIYINVGEQEAVLLDASLYYDPAALTFVGMETGKGWPKGGRLIITHDAEAGRVRFAGIMLENTLKGYGIVVEATFTAAKPNAGYVTGELHALLDSEASPISSYENPLRPETGVLLIALKKKQLKKLKKGKKDPEDFLTLPESGVVGGDGGLLELCAAPPCTKKACATLLAPDTPPSIDFNNDCFFDVRDVALLMGVARGERTLPVPPGSSGLMAVLHAGDLDRSGVVDNNDVLLAMSTSLGAIPLLEEVDFTVADGGCAVKIVTSFLALKGGKASLGSSRLFIAVLSSGAEADSFEELFTLEQGTLVEKTPYPLYPKQWKQEQKKIAAGEKDKYSKFLPGGMVVEAVQNKINSFVAELQVEGGFGTAAFVLGFVDENTAMRQDAGEGGILGDAILLAGVPNNDGGGTFKDVDMALDTEPGQRFRLRSSDPFGGYASLSLSSSAGCLTTPEQTTVDPDMTEPPTEPPTMASTTTFTPWVVPGNLVFNTPVHRINCGSTIVEGDYVDRSGNVWAVDYGFTGPSQRSLAPDASIASTREDGLFRFERFMTSDQPLHYSLPVAEAGFYRVRLFFADTCKCTSDPNERRFDVFLEGRKVLQNLDLTATYGWRTAVIFEYDILVEDEAVDITLGRILQAPLINAIEVLAVSAVEATTSTTTTTSPTLPDGVEDPLDGFELTFSTTENQSGQRFGNAFRQVDRAFAMRTVIETGATRLIFSRQCAERCLDDASCQGLYVYLDDDEASPRRVYCIGLTQLDGAKAVGGDTFSYTRTAPAAETTTAASVTTLAGADPLSQAQFNAAFLQIHSAQTDGMRFRFSHSLSSRVFRLEAPAAELDVLLRRCGATCQRYDACVGVWVGVENSLAVCNGLDQTGTPKKANLVESRSFLRI